MVDAARLPGGEDRERTVRNLKFLGWAMHMFARDHGGRLPAASARGGVGPTLSWRVLLLPYLEQSRLFARFRLDEPWDGPRNGPLLAEMPDVFRPGPPDAAPPHATRFQTLVGRGALFDGGEGPILAGAVAAGSPTLMVVESARPVPWIKPEDIPCDAADPLPALGGPHAGGSHAGFADGSVGFLARDIAPETLRRLITGGR